MKVTLLQPPPPPVPTYHTTFEQGDVLIFSEQDGDRLQFDHAGNTWFIQRDPHSGRIGYVSLQAVLSGATQLSLTDPVNNRTFARPLWKRARIKEIILEEVPE